MIVLAIVALIALLPRRYHFTPSWFAYATVSLMIAPMLLVVFTKGRGVWTKVERAAEIFAVSIALVCNVGNLLIASYNLVEKPGTLEPVPLFYTSIGIWTGNVLIFTLLYWLVDGGGADARLNGMVKYPDFDFPAMAEDARVPPNWRPGIPDYLFLAFTTSTAFSPTEAMPMTTRAKMLMVFQSMLALITIAIVAARTINILK
jgi:hypothetical protein